MLTRQMDVDTVQGLVEHLLAGAPAIPAVRKLVSPDVNISISAAPGQLALLGPASGPDVATLLKSFELVSVASEAIDLKWTARFLHVEESFLQLLPGQRQGVASSDTWIAQIEWQLKYEPPSKAGRPAGKRFKLWTSSPRTIQLFFATRNSTSNTSETHVQNETQSQFEVAIKGAQAEQSEFELVAVEYSLWPTLPFPLSWIDAALPTVIKQSILAMQSRLLFAGLRLSVAIFDPDQLEPTAPTASHLPDPEAPAPPIHLRHHQRHYEPELQAEPGPSSELYAETPEPSHHYHRRRWSASTPQHATPATTAAAARLHLERPLAERHVQPLSVLENAQQHQHEPAHAHPLPSSSGLARRGHVRAHQPSHPHHAHPHRHHHLSGGQHHHGHRHGLLYRLLKFPLELVALLVQVVQIIFFDFTAVGEFFGRMIEALMASFVEPRGNEQKSPDRIQVGTESLLVDPGHSRRVSFAESVSSEPEAIPLNPPPSPHLALIAEEAAPWTTPPEGGALESTYPRTLDSHGHLVSSSLIASLPIPIDVDAHALALHEQLANEAAAQGHFRAELEEAGVITPPKVVQVSERDVEVHREVAKEVARVAGSMERVERMGERFAVGGPELGELVERVGGDSTRSRTLGEHSPSSPARHAISGEQELGDRSSRQAAAGPLTVEPPTAISPDRPGLRKASSAPPSSSKDDPEQQVEPVAASREVASASSRAAEKLALQGRLGLIEPSSMLQSAGSGTAVQPESGAEPSGGGLLGATASGSQSESRRTSIGSITIGSSVGEALPRPFDDDENLGVESALAPRMGVPLTSTPPPPPEPIAAGAGMATSPPVLPSLPIEDLPSDSSSSRSMAPPERPATAATTVQDPLMVMHGLGLGPEWRRKLSSSPGKGGVGGLSETGESGVVWPYRQQQQQQAVVSTSGAEQEEEQPQQQERSIDPPVRFAHSAEPAPGVGGSSKLASPAIPAGMVRSLSYSPASATLSPPPTSSSVVTPVLIRSSSETGVEAMSPSSLSDPLGGSPASLRMQHELSTSGPFTSSQGRLSATATSASPPMTATVSVSGFAAEVAQGESESSMGLAMSTRTPPPSSSSTTLKQEEHHSTKPLIHPAHEYDERVEAGLGQTTTAAMTGGGPARDPKDDDGKADPTASGVPPTEEQATLPASTTQGNGGIKAAGGNGGRGGSSRGGGRSGHKKKKSKGR